MQTKKGTIVMLHGNSSSSKVFNPVLNSNISHNLLAFDLIGHGDNKPSGDYTINAYIKAILAIIKEIDGDILLVGNSLGGHLAIEVANDIPNLKGLLIFGAPPIKKPINFEEAFVPIPELNTFFDPTPSDEQIDATIDLAVVNKSIIPILKADFLKADPLIRSTLATEFANPDAFSDELEIITNLSCQKYIIKGDQDPAINPIYLETISTGNNVELITIDNCGHYPTLEKPEEFISHLKKIANKVFSC